MSLLTLDEHRLSTINSGFLCSNPVPNSTTPIVESILIFSGRNANIKGRREEHVRGVIGESCLGHEMTNILCMFTSPLILIPTGRSTRPRSTTTGRILSVYFLRRQHYGADFNVAGNASRGYATPVPINVPGTQLLFSWTDYPTKNNGRFTINICCLWCIVSISDTALHRPWRISKAAMVTGLSAVRYDGVFCYFHNVGC